MTDTYTAEDHQRFAEISANVARVRAEYRYGRHGTLTICGKTVNPARVREARAALRARENASLYAVVAAAAVFVIVSAVAYTVALPALAQLPGVFLDSFRFTFSTAIIGILAALGTYLLTAQVLSGWWDRVAARPGTFQDVAS